MFDFAFKRKGFICPAYQNCGSLSKGQLLNDCSVLLSDQSNKHFLYVFWEVVIKKYYF